MRVQPTTLAKTKEPGRRRAAPPEEAARELFSVGLGSSGQWDNVLRNTCLLQEANTAVCKNVLLPTWSLGSERRGGLEKDQSQLGERLKKCQQQLIRAWEGDRGKG